MEARTSRIFPPFAHSPVRGMEERRPQGHNPARLASKVGEGIRCCSGIALAVILATAAVFAAHLGWGWTGWQW